ncbi:MAG TPA: peptidase S1 [Clostridiales bacterium]|nr:peptidase S1 [Clostridiales bacterium]
MKIPIKETIMKGVKIMDYFDMNRRHTSSDFDFPDDRIGRGRRERKGVGLVTVIIIALLTSIVGGGVTYLAMTSLNQVTAESTLDTTPASSQNGNTTEVVTKYEIQKIDSPVVAIADKVSPSVVGIVSTYSITDFFFGNRQSGSEGSGIIIDAENGYVVTNNHVIESSMNTKSNDLLAGARIEVILPREPDKRYAATVVGRDSETDLALLKIDAPNLVAAELGDSDDLKVGELAVAIGNPGGSDFLSSVTAGVISGLDRNIGWKSEEGNVYTLIQTDAAINPGNSGGALVNSRGQVVGINTVKITASGYEGLGFAIPINRVKEITNSLLKDGYVSRNRPWLGVSISTQYNEQVATQFKLPAGAYIVEVTADSPAKLAGLKVNDIITKADGKEIKTGNELIEIVNKKSPGDVISIEYYRTETKETMQVDVIIGDER